MFRSTTLVTARKVLRSEGLVWRYDYMQQSVQVRGDKESGLYTHLRDFLGASKAQAEAVIAAAQADAEADEVSPGAGPRHNISTAVGR